jgi:FKBP-type peptidyl-prolyl cis-trans isomerase
MNIKGALIALVVVALIGVGGYFAYQNFVATPTTEQQDQEIPTDQVQAQEVTVGTGKEATPGSIVSVLYVGRLSDGTVFDSSEAHDNEPLIFQLGAPGIISGFQIGINGMREGGERLLAIPPTLGYGGDDITNPTTGAVVIPGNSTLIFNVQLLSVQDAPTENTETTTETTDAQDAQ